MGAGDRPCVILTVGAHAGPEARYPVSELAARYGASVEKETSDPEQVYATAERFRRGRPPSGPACPGLEPFAVSLGGLSRALAQGAARSSDLDLTRGETAKLLEMARSPASALPARPSVLHRCTSVGVAGIAVARAYGDREGGAPLVVFALLLVGVVTLDAVGRGVVAVVRRLILDGGLRRHS